MLLCWAILTVVPPYQSLVSKRIWKVCFDNSIISNDNFLSFNPKSAIKTIFASAKFKNNNSIQAISYNAPE